MKESKDIIKALKRYAFCHSMAPLPLFQPSYKGLADLIKRWIRQPSAQRLSSSSPHSSSPAVPDPMASGYSTLTLPDGAKLAYEVLGSYHLGRAMPIVLVCGMTSARVDYERLTASLIKTRPVLIYDHRGMGDSTLVPTEDEDLTIELLARDLAALLTHLKWKELALMGYSMGGVIAQQMLLLPYHPNDPTTLPFHVTHLFLAGTRSIVIETAGLPIAPPPPAGTMRTPEEKMAIVRRIVGSLVDPTWIKANASRFDALFKRAINPAIKRPPVLIAKQGAALRKFDFANLLGNIPRDMQIMVIHGRLDQVIPFECGEEIIKRIPQARFVEHGNLPGQVPTLNFGHFWYEYFDIQIWHDVVDNFIGTVGPNFRTSPLHS